MAGTNFLINILTKGAKKSEKDVKGFEPNIHTYNAFNVFKGALIPKAGTIYFIPSHLDFKFSVNNSCNYLKNH